MAEPYLFRAELRRFWRLYAVLLVGLLIWGWMDVRWRGIIEPDRLDRHKTDLTAYTEAAAAFFDGRDPYAVTNVRGWGYLYPPIFALLLTPLIGLDSQTQVFLFYLASLVIGLGCYVELRRIIAALARPEVPLPRVVSPGNAHPDSSTGLPLSAASDWLAMGLAVALPALNTLQRGQVGLLKLYPLLLGTRLVLFPRNTLEILLGGIALAFPIALKVTPALPVGMLLAGLVVRALVVRSDRSLRQSAFMATSGVVIGSLVWWLLIPAAVLGWDANIAYLHRWHGKVIVKAEDVRSDDFGGDVTSPRNQSLANAAYRMGNWFAYRTKLGPDDRLIDTTETATGKMPMDAPAAERTVWSARVLTVLALAATVIVLGRRGSRLDFAVLMGIGCVATLVVSPVSRGHYFVLLAPPLLLIPVWLRTVGYRGIADLTPFIPAAACLAHYLGLEFTGRIGLLGMTTAFWLWAVLARVLAAGRQPSAAELAASPANRPTVRRAA